VPITHQPLYPSLKFDHNDIPYISYYDATGFRYYLLTTTSTSGSGNWYIYEFPHQPSGASIALPAANSTALAMIRGVGTSTPVMIVIDNSAASKTIRAASFVGGFAPFSAVSTIETLDTAGAANIDARADSSGNVAVVYHHLSTAITSGRVKFSVSSNQGSTWSTPISLSSAGQGEGVNLTLDPVTQKPRVSFFDRASNWVLTSECTTAISSCSSSGNWSATEQIESGAGVSGLTAVTAPAHNQLLSAFPYIDRTSKSYIFYPRGAANNASLMATHNVSGSWSSTTIRSGVNGNLVGIAPANMSVAGWNVQVTENASYSPTAAYIGPGNWLYVTSCGD